MNLPIYYKQAKKHSFGELIRCWNSRNVSAEKKEKGQSLVELALFFPILMMMLSGLVEFGLLLNQYLNLMDGPREASRFGVDRSPFVGATENDDIQFYTNADLARPGLSEMAVRTIFPYNLDPSVDDIVISVVAAKNGAIFRRYPDDVGVRSTVAGAGNEFSYTGNKVSDFSDAEITAMLNAGVPKAGIVIVEMWLAIHRCWLFRGSPPSCLIPFNCICHRWHPCRLHRLLIQPRFHNGIYNEKTFLPSG